MKKLTWCRSWRYLIFLVGKLSTPVQNENMGLLLFVLFTFDFTFNLKKGDRDTGGGNGDTHNFWLNEVLILILFKKKWRHIPISRDTGNTCVLFSCLAPTPKLLSYSADLTNCTFGDLWLFHLSCNDEEFSGWLHSLPTLK